MNIERASKKQIKFVQSLKLKKYRQKYGVFVAEGRKVVQEILKDGKLGIEAIFALPSWIEKHSSLIGGRKQVCLIDEMQLRKASAFKEPDEVIVVCAFSEQRAPQGMGWTLFLDQIRDPGNLGTVVRTIDWFGLKHIVLSPGTVDLFNPKTVHAAMGSIGRVDHCYMSFHQLLKQLPDTPLYIADTGGAAAKAYIDKPGIVVIGNESHGVSDAIRRIPNTISITIPKGEDSVTESLNAAVATAAIFAVLHS